MAFTTGNLIYASGSNTTLYYPTITAATYIQEPVPAPKKKTALDWLDDRVNEMRSVAQAALAT